MGLIILVLLIVITIEFFVWGGLLVWVTKLFKIENPSYKKSLIILIISMIGTFVMGAIFRITNLVFLSSILQSIAVFFVFCYFYKKYYQSSWKKTLGVYIVFWIVAYMAIMVFVIPIRLYIVSPVVVSGETMSPTYNNGDYLLINKFDKSFSRGDVVVFQYEKQSDTIFIKRVIGLPLEKVDIRGGQVLVNDQVLSETYYNGETSGSISVVLGQNQYFVLGDNRSASFDSRSFGPINQSSIEGKVFYKVFGLAK